MWQCATFFSTEPYVTPHPSFQHTKKNTFSIMAKKTDNAGGAVPSPRFLLGITLIGAGILLFIAIGSFFYTGGADRSIFDLPLVDLITDKDIEVTNPLGKAGAWIADMLVTNGIGVASLAIPWLIAATGLHIIGVKKVSLRKQLAYCLGFAIWGSIAMGFLFSRFSDQWYLLVGGAHGHFMAKWLSSAIGPVGTLALLALSLFGFIATKHENLRVKIVSLLQRINIKIPHIPLDTDEETATPQAADGKTEDEDNNSNINADNMGVDSCDAEGVEETEDSDDQQYTTGEAGSSGMEVSYATDEYSDDEHTPTSPTEAQGPQAPDFTVTNTQSEKIVDGDHLGIDTKFDPTEGLPHYEFPSINLLKDYGKQTNEVDQDILIENKNKIVQTLENFQIRIDSIKATVGPTVTLYEIVPAPGIRISKVKSLEDDIAMSLSALGIRIVAPLPGKGTIGIEVPNTNPQIVSMQSVIRSTKFQESRAELPVAMGKTIANETFVFDLAKTPHLLVAGATGQGKSVGLNAIVTSILYKKHPAEVKFVLVDPKMVEFSIYKVLEKHYLAKMDSEDEAVITDIDKVKSTLQSLTIEMDDRYKLLEKASVRGIKDYNAKFIDRKLNPENGHRFLPYIIVIIDEFADLIMTAGKEVETPIARIAQKARAVGIHMILATQRPSTNIITGVIKANFPSRIAFKVSSGIDSRTILDSTGAQSLIGRGDMLIQLTGQMSPTRVQCAFVDTPEVEDITQFIANQPGYPCAYPLPDVTMSADGTLMEAESDGAPGKFDSKIREIAQMVVESQIGSTSNIQRRFGVGYNRAGKIMDQLERMGIVSRADGSKPRTVYIQTEAELDKILQSFGISN